VGGQSHHYVPKVYLTGFFDPKQVARKQNVLWRYRPGGRPEAKGLTKVAEQTDFYDLPELGDEDNDIEEMLSQIERTVSWHLKKLRDGKWPLTHREKAEVAGYIALQYTRTPWFRELANKSAISLQRAGLKDMLERPGEVEDFLEQMKRETDETVGDVDSLKKFMERVADGSIPAEQKNKAWNAKVMLQHSNDLSERFFRMRWSLVEAPEGSAFITSDVPTSIVDPAVETLGPEGYKISAEMEVYFPVSPHFAVVGDHRSGPDRRLAITAESVQNFNADQMKRCQEIYASLHSKELQAEFDRIVKERPPSIRELPQQYLRATIERARVRAAVNRES